MSVNVLDKDGTTNEKINDKEVTNYVVSYHHHCLASSNLLCSKQYTTRP